MQPVEILYSLTKQRNIGRCRWRNGHLVCVWTALPGYQLDKFQTETVDQFVPNKYA